MKVWLINEIKRAEIKLKYLNALLIMLSHVERADDYSDSDDDFDATVDSDGDSIKASDIQLLDDEE
jgi:hypothetical protein